MDYLQWIFPKRCVECNRVGAYLCSNCQNKIRVPSPICPTCTRSSVGGWIHPRCQSNDCVERLVVGLGYKGIVQKLLKRVKYRSQSDILGLLVKMWEERIDLDIGKDEWVITSVPMWHQKERERGYNQAELIATKIAEIYGIKYIKLLERVRETMPQYGLSKLERKENVRKAFKVTPEIYKAKNLGVILIDDVWTTGATIKECGATLQDSGVKIVWAVTLAR